MKRYGKISSVLMTALLIVMSACAFASAESSSFEGTYTFNGKKITSDVSAEEVADAVSSLQPGDDVTFTFVYENDQEESTDWYMENEIVQTLECTNAARKQVDGTGEAENGGYTYELTLHDSDGNTNVLYSSDKVGGDNGTVPDPDGGSDLTGLEPATSALEDWFYIDTLENKGDSGSVVLHVAFDGETEVNDYMDTEGEFTVRFAAEITPEGGSSDQPTSAAVKTGDQNDLIMWAAIGLIGGMLLLIMVFLSRRKDLKSAGPDSDKRGGDA